MEDKTQQHCHTQPAGNPTQLKNFLQSDYSCNIFKGTVSRDFLSLVYIIKQLPVGPHPKILSLTAKNSLIHLAFNFAVITANLLLFHPQE